MSDFDQAAADAKTALARTVKEGLSGYSVPGGFSFSLLSPDDILNAYLRLKRLDPPAGSSTSVVAEVLDP